MSIFVEGFLNGVFVDPAKIGPELFKINGLSFDRMFVLSNVGLVSYTTSFLYIIYIYIYVLGLPS